MRVIKISDERLRKLRWLAANYFVVKGDTPMDVEKLVAELIDAEYREANPPEYNRIQERGD